MVWAKSDNSIEDSTISFRAAFSRKFFWRILKKSGSQRSSAASCVEGKLGEVLDEVRMVGCRCWLKLSDRQMEVHCTITSPRFIFEIWVSEKKDMLI